MMRPADMRTENERGGLKKLIAKTTFPANFKEKVDMSKVNMETMVPWIQAEVEKYVGFDDEVLVGYVQSQLAPPDGSSVDPRAVQINLMGFLEKNTSTFMKELCALALAPTLAWSLARSLARSLAPTLTSGQPSALIRSLAPTPSLLSRWTLLLSAQRHPMGIPEEFIERKRAPPVHTRRPPPAAPCSMCHAPARRPGRRPGGQGWAWGAVPLAALLRSLTCERSAVLSHAAQARGDPSEEGGGGARARAGTPRTASTPHGMHPMHPPGLPPPRACPPILHPPG